MEFEQISIQEHVNLVMKFIINNKSNSDQSMLELGLVRNVDHKTSSITYSIADKKKWFLAKIKYGI